MSFNPIEYLYLNPELQAYSNIITVEQANSYYISGSNSLLFTSLSNIPDEFNSESFLTFNPIFQDISMLSYTIRVAMSNIGIKSKDIESKSRYISSIFKPMTYQELNSFGYDVFSLSNFLLTESNIGVEDEIFFTDSNNERYFGKVVNYTSNTISLYPTPYRFFIGSNYTLQGIKVTDSDRVARINYIRNYSNIINQSNNIIDRISPEFNVSLYKLLYPDANGLSDPNAYLDYLAKKTNRIPRIQNALDLISSVSIDFNNINYLRVLSNITIVGEAVFGNQTVFDGNVVTNGGLSSCNDTSMGGNLLVSCNITAKLDINTCNNIYIGDNLIVNSNIRTSNNLFIDKDLYVGSNIIGSNDLYILNNQITKGTLIVNSNITTCNNLIVQNNTFVGQDLITSSNIRTSNNLFIDKDLYIGSNIIGSNNLYILNNQITKGTLIVNSNITTCNNLVVQNNTFIGQDLITSSNIRTSNNLFIDKDLYIGSNIIGSNNLYILNNQITKGTLIVNSNITTCNNLIVQNDGFIKNNLIISGYTTLSNNLNVYGITVLSNDLYVTGDQINTKTLIVGEDITGLNNLTILCNVEIGSNLNISHNLNIEKSLNVESNSTFEKNIYIREQGIFNSNIIGSNNLHIDKNAFIKSNLSLSNDLDVYGQARIRNSLILSGNASFTTTNFNDKMTANCNVSISKNLIVYGSASVNGHLYNPRLGLGYMGTYLESNEGNNIINAENYNDNSDFRIKKNIKNKLNNLNTIEQIDIKEFKYNYGISNLDDKIYYGCIAQDIEKLDKNIVYHTEGYIPDIMQECICNFGHIILSKKMNINVNDTIKILYNNIEHLCLITDKLNDNEYLINPPLNYNNIKCTIYGKKIYDLKNIDYKQLFVIAIGAIKELKNEIELMKINNNLL